MHTLKLTTLEAGLLKALFAMAWKGGVFQDAKSREIAVEIERKLGPLAPPAQMVSNRPQKEAKK